MTTTAFTMHLPRRGRAWAAAVAAGALAAVAGGLQSQSDPSPRLPFAAGEEAVYRASGGPLGRIGTGTMRVSDAGEVRGRETLLLSFDLHGRVGPAAVEDRTRSWVHPDQMASVRYTKQERSPVSNRSQQVEIYPARLRWEGADGQAGTLPTAAPLDELSFLYFIRTLPLADGAVYSLSRHFEAERNPVVVRVVRRGRTTAPAGEFATVEVEMRVKDPARYRGGEGVIRLFLTDDECRVPVRIESSMPVVGRAVLTLQSYTPGRGHGPLGHR